MPYRIMNSTIAVLALTALLWLPGGAEGEQQQTQQGQPPQTQRGQQNPALNRLIEDFVFVRFHNLWNFVVESENGQVYLKGEVPQLAIMRKAVDAARQTQGVMSVRSDFELERIYARYPYWPFGYGAYRAYPYVFAHPDVFVYDIDVAPPAGGQAMSTLTGEVTKVDRPNGTVTLKTDTGPVDLKLSPDALQNLEPGEQITLQIGLRQASPAASPRTDGSMQQKNGKQ